jgi:hypothetical protein
VSLREKRIGKAVPTSATATAPAMRYVLPSAATSPTAASQPGALLLDDLVLLIDGIELAAGLGGGTCRRSPAGQHALTAAAIDLSAS